MKELYNDKINWGPQVRLLQQHKLPLLKDKYEEFIDSALSKLLEKGGEGLMVRNPYSIWTPKRTKDLLKIKKYVSDEGIVIGYMWGKGKLEGMIGSIIVEWKGKSFELSGFTDLERYIDKRYYLEAGKIISNNLESTLFPRGSKIKFKYRELTVDGIPKEARYLR